jgi:drug/metabolite transporter (DMT)-like permease
VLGGFLALLSAASFAAESSTARRGVLTGSVAQALSITIPLGVPLFLIVVAVFGSLGSILSFSPIAVLWLSLAGIVHFVWGRYCNYRSQKAIGAVLAAPVQQSSLLVTLVFSIWILGEYLTPLRVIGIALVFLGPALAYERGEKPAAEPVPGGPLAAPAPAKVFEPKYAEGYFFGLMSATGYGLSPVFVSLGLEGKSLQASLAAGLISYLAATAAFALILLLPGQLRHVRALERDAAKWFVVSGVFVCAAQMFRYMALAVAPASVVAPILRLSMLFRFHFARMFNPHHEVFGGKAVAATIVSLAGALALSVSTEAVQALMPLPEWLATTISWRWP